MNVADEDWRKIKTYRGYLCGRFHVNWRYYLWVTSRLVPYVMGKRKTWKKWKEKYFWMKEIKSSGGGG